MPRQRDPNFTTGHLCRFCGELVPWGTILRLIRVDPDTPGFMLNESACHTECLERHLRPGAPLTFHRHWEGRAPMLDDSADVDGKPCAFCGKAIAPPELVRLRVQKPVGPVKQPKFDEQTLPLHFDCLAAVSNTIVPDPSRRARASTRRNSKKLQALRRVLTPHRPTEAVWTGARALVRFRALNRLENCNA